MGSSGSGGRERQWEESTASVTIFFNWGGSVRGECEWANVIEKGERRGPEEKVSREIY